MHGLRDRLTSSVCPLLTMVEADGLATACPEAPGNGETAAARSPGWARAASSPSVFE